MTHGDHSITPNTLSTRLCSNSEFDIFSYFELPTYCCVRQYLQMYRLSITSLYDSTQFLRVRNLEAAHLGGSGLGVAVRMMAEVLSSEDLARMEDPHLSSLTWLLAGGFSYSPCGSLMPAAFPQSKR